MKLHASRGERDLNDAATLFNTMGYSTAQDGIDLLADRYPAAQLLPRHRYVVEDVAERAAAWRATRVSPTGSSADAVRKAELQEKMAEVQRGATLPRPSRNDSSRDAADTTRVVSGRSQARQLRAAAIRTRLAASSKTADSFTGRCSAPARLVCASSPVMGHPDWWRARSQVWTRGTAVVIAESAAESRYVLEPEVGQGNSTRRYSGASCSSRVRKRSGAPTRSTPSALSAAKTSLLSGRPAAIPNLPYCNAKSSQPSTKRAHASRAGESPSKTTSTAPTPTTPGPRTVGLCASQDGILGLQAGVLV